MGFVEELYGPQIEEEQAAAVYEYQNTPENRSWAGALPVKQGLYDPDLEKDACGVGFAAYVHSPSSVVQGTNSLAAISRVRRVTKSLAMV